MPQAIFLLILKLFVTFVLQIFWSCSVSYFFLVFLVEIYFPGFPGRVQTLEGMLRAKDEVQLVYVMKIRQFGKRATDSYRSVTGRLPVT